MSDDKDVPVNLPLHKRFWSKIQASMGFSVFCAVLIVSLIALGIIGNYWHEDWEAEQWGPVAAWFGGLLTAGAVTLSLYQSRAARKEANQNRDDAERRHIEQLEERKNLRQIDSLAPVWAALNSLTVPATKYSIALLHLQDMKNQLNGQPTDGSAAAAIGLSQEQVSIAADRVAREYVDLATYLAAMEMACTESLIVMDDEHVLALLEDLYKAHQTYCKSADDTVKAALDNTDFDYENHRRLKTEVNNKRNSIVNLARKHLAHARPLTIEFFNATQTDPPESE